LIAITPAPDTGPLERTSPQWLSGYSVQPWHGATSANDCAGRFWGPKCKRGIIDRKPRRNLESLFAGVTQKTNAPYSQKDIEVSAEALRKAGGLPKVDVNVVPDVSRVRVNFLLEPGVVSYPGAEKQFLLISGFCKSRNLSDGDPCDPARISLDEYPVREFLQRS